MGMHFGILAAEASWETLRKHLVRHVGELHPAGPSQDFENLSSQNAADFVLVAGEYAGKAYIIDESFELSMANPDLIMALSVDIAGRVVGCGAETVSGSFDFQYAENGTLRRLYHQCNSALSLPFQLGSPLACEEKNAYDHLYGEGLIAGLREAGFDYEAFHEHGSHSCYYYTPSNVPLHSGEIGKQLTDHHEKYKLPEDQIPPPVLVLHGVIRQPSGFWGWLRSLFGK